MPRLKLEDRNNVNDIKIGSKWVHISNGSIRVIKAVGVDFVRFIKDDDTEITGELKGLFLMRNKLEEG